MRTNGQIKPMPQADTPEIGTLRDLARAALRNHNGKTTEATEALVKQLTKNNRLLRRVVAEAVAFACSGMVDQAMRHKRDRISASANLALVRSVINATSAINAREGVRALSAGIESTLLDFPLAGGLKLRDATAEQVTMQADLYEKAGNDALHKSKFLRARCRPRQAPGGKRISCPSFDGMEGRRPTSAETGDQSPGVGGPNLFRRCRPFNV